MDRCHLRQQRANLLGLSVSSSTAKAYDAANLSYRNFCQIQRISPYPLSTDSVTLFITWLANQDKTVGYIRSIISGIQFHHTQLGYQDPNLDNRYISRLYKGVDNSANVKRKRTRLPVDLPLLDRIVKQLPSGFINPHDCAMYKSAFCLAFWGFLRVSEFTSPSWYVADVTRTLMLDDVVITDSKIILKLKKSKTDQLGSLPPICLCKLDSPLCPVASLRQYLTYRSKLPGPLFQSHAGLFLTRGDFTKALHTVLSSLNVDASLYNSHSLRIGAATTAAQKGVNPAIIKILGRWKSNCYSLYVKPSKNCLTDAIKQML